MWFWVGLASGVVGTRLYFWWIARKYFWRCPLCDMVAYCPDEPSIRYFKEQHIMGKHPVITSEEMRKIEGFE